ncbi:MAG: hypothetical protein JSS20_21945, partial [Proteobacteria bacterium]|nr:hypothetical protein [Pseudomonadota bacterium]
INKITASLTKLEAAAKRINGLKIGGNAAELSSNLMTVSRLAMAYDRLNKAASGRGIQQLGNIGSGNVSGLAGVANAVSRLQAALSQPIRTAGLTAAINRISALNTSGLGAKAGQINQLAAALRNYASASSAAAGARQPHFGRGSVPPVPPHGSGPGSTGFGGGYGGGRGIVGRVGDAVGYTVSHTAYGAGHLAFEQAREISSGRDIVANRLGWDEATQRVMQAEARAATKQFGTLPQAEAERMFRELSSAVHDPKEVAKIFPLFAKAYQDQIIMGLKPHEASAAMTRVIRSVEMSGKLVDREGHVNEPATKEYLETLTRAQTVEGSRLLGARDLQLYEKYIRSSGVAQNQEARLRGLFLASEEG